MKAKVRTAIKSDIPLIVKMGAKFYEESNFEKGGFDGKRFTEILEFMHECGEHITLIAEVKGQAIGFIIFDVSRHYTKYLISCMYLFYVDKDNRKHNAGAELIKAAKIVARQKGAKYFYGSSSAGFEDEGKNERALIGIYERQGFKDNGVFMRVEL